MNEGQKKYKIVVCRGPECGDRRGSEALYQAFAEILRTRGLERFVELGWQSCYGRCSLGPNVLVRLAPTEQQRFTVAIVPVGSGQNAALYNHVATTDVARIVDEHVIAGRILRDMIVRPGAPGNPQGGEPR